VQRRVFGRILRLPKLTQPLRWAPAAICAFTLAAPAPALAAPTPSVTAAPVRSVRTALGTVGYRSIGHGRPLVLIMGLAGSIDAWQPKFIDALARHHRVIAFDNEGIGRSSLRPGPLTISRVADDTAALIRALHLRQPDVLGWSMGGFIAQALAVRHPGRYRRLILSATAPGNGHAELPSAAVGKVLADGGGNILGDLFPPDQARQGPAYVAAITKYPHFYLPPAKVDALQLIASTRWLGGHDPSGRALARLRVPTLISDGAQDVILPAANSTKLGRLLPDARVKLYPDAGHGFLFQDESSWVTLIERFLRPGVPSRR
jgi:pimeloyl-ACP methyl ester carboxylesterase